MGSGEDDGLGVGFDVDGTNRIKCRSQIGEGFGDNVPLKAERLWVLAAETGNRAISQQVGVFE